MYNHIVTFKWFCFLHTYSFRGVSFLTLMFLTDLCIYQVSVRKRNVRDTMILSIDSN